MNRKVLGVIGVIAVILVVLFSVRGFNDGDKDKKVVINVPEATEQQEVVVPVNDNKEEIVESVEVKDDKTFVSEGVKEIQQLKEEAGKENPLTEEEMFKISQEQIQNYFSFSIVDSEEELKVLAKKFYYYYNDDSLEHAKTRYEPGVNKNLKLEFKQENTTKNGRDTFTYVGMVTVSADNIKTKSVDSFTQKITIDFMKATDGTYKVINFDPTTIK
ncbi:hypothetical protein NST74_24275 [Paenibacillus sp. FSL F4-0125]|uniref:hypothetical protein n=1 Tax=Paenibacillus sp. FSL F4-0125 TaxID=2954730 RepID=UPI0030FA1B19